jgi:hypothetical protein
MSNKCHFHLKKVTVEINFSEIYISVPLVDILKENEIGLIIWK